MGSCNQDEKKGGGGGGGGFMSNLPSEILFEVLLRVPIKALSHCRFVCKSWFHTIQNPNFRAAYNTNNSFLILHSSKLCLVVVDFETSPSPVVHPLKMPPNAQPNRRIYSCNGLLLLECYPDFHYCIVNPITGYQVAVPPSPLQPLLHKDAYHSSTGFGYDPFSQVCKVIRIVFLEFSKAVEIYNLVTGEWRIMGEDKLLIKSFCPNDQQPSLEEIDLSGPSSTYLNGALHWIGYWEASDLVTIISFKLDTEEFYRIPLFPGLDRDSLMACPILALRECLSLVFSIDDEHVEIWVMNDYGLESSWEKKYVITNVTMDDGCSIKGWYSPILFMQNGELLLLYSLDERLGCYHTVTKAFRSLESLDDLVEQTWHSPCVHVASLKSPASIRK